MHPVVREVRSARAPPVAARRRVAQSFHRLSRRDGIAGREPLGQLQWATSLYCSRRLLVKNFDAPRLVAKSWFTYCRRAAERCPLRDRKITLLLCSGAALVARQWKCTHVSCVGEPVAGVSSFGADGPAATRHRPVMLSQNWSPSTDRISRTCKHGWLPWLTPCWLEFSASCSRDHRAHDFSENLREHEFGYWLHRQDV